MFIHPEVKNEFTFQMRYVAHNKPELDYEQARMLAFVNTWNDALSATNVFVENHMCPYDFEKDLDWLERDVRLQEVLDKEIEQLEAEDF